MKQKIISGLKKKLLLVELPEGVTDVNHSRALGNSMIVYKINGQDAVSPIPTNDWKLAGKLTDIKEEQLSGVIDELNHKGSYFFLSRKDSLLAVLEATGIYFKNPLDATDVKLETGDLGVDDAEWQEAESKVWDKDRTYLFEIL